MVSRNLQCLVNKLCGSRGVNCVPLLDANRPTFGFESTVSLPRASPFRRRQQMDWQADADRNFNSFLASCAVAASLALAVTMAMHMLL